MFKMLNLEVALSSFWQLARHWRQGEEAKLELSCKDGNLQIQLSASLGHPDKQHFPNPLPSSKFKEPKKKSPSQLRRQEPRWRRPGLKLIKLLPIINKLKTFFNTIILIKKSGPELYIYAYAPLYLISTPCTSLDLS